MAGYTFADPGQFFDFYLIKTDENGNLLWDRTYGGVWQEMAYDIKETEDGYVVAGYTQSYGNGGFEMYLVKTDKNGLVSINDDNGSNLISEFTLFQNFPNPFNPSTTINFIIPNKAYTTLRIYDVLGRKVQTLFEAELSSGSHHIVFNASFISSGIYFYQLNTGDFSQTKKMILLR